MIGGGYWLGLPFSTILAAFIVLLTALLTRRTALGVLLESVGGNPEASRLAGVPARTITWTVYIVCALFAGIAGLMITSDATAADPNSTGLFLEIDAILAVVIGGTSLAGGRFSLAGTVIGAFIIQTLTQMILILGIAPEITLVYKAGVVVAVCLIQSPEFRAFALRAVRTDRPAPPLPPSVEQVSSSALDRARTRRRRTRRPRREHQPGAVMSTNAATLVRPFGQSWGRYLPVMATGVLLLVAIAVGGLLYDNFITGQVLANILITNSHLIALAVGLTFVILTGGIDLSVGAVVALSAMIAARLMDGGWPAAAAIPLVLVIGSLLGLLVGLMIHYFRIQPFIATLAAMFLARGMCYVISIQSIPINERFFVYMSRKRLTILPDTTITPAVLVALGMVVVAFYVLHYTRFGRTVYAIGGSEPSAVLMGLPVPRVKVSVYVISGFCASLGGMLYTFNAVQSGNPLHAIGMELDAIASVAIGGHAAHRGLRLHHRIVARGPRDRHDLVDHQVQRHAQLRMDADRQRAARPRIHRDAAGDHAGTRPPCVTSPRRRARPGCTTSPSVAQVSHQTVSRVLNDHPHVRPDTKERVQRAIAELGYRRNAAARSLVTRRSGVIGVLTPRTELYGPTSSMIAVEVAAREAGYFVSLASVADTSAAALGATRSTTSRTRPPRPSC